MTYLEVFKFNPRVDVHLEKCPNLESLKITFYNPGYQVSLRRIPALISMPHLTKLVLVRVTIDETSLNAFDDFLSLKYLELVRCAIVCDYGELGLCIARSSIKSVTLRTIACYVEDIELLLASVKLDYLFISNFTSKNRLGSAIDLFRSFGDAFHCKRNNPREAFLIEQDGFARNHNGKII